MPNGTPLTGTTPTPTTGPLAPGSTPTGAPDISSLTGPTWTSGVPGILSQLGARFFGLQYRSTMEQGSALVQNLHTMNTDPKQWSMVDSIVNDPKFKSEAKKFGIPLEPLKANISNQRAYMQGVQQAAALAGQDPKWLEHPGAYLSAAQRAGGLEEMRGAEQLLKPVESLAGTETREAGEAARKQVDVKIQHEHDLYRHQDQILRDKTSLERAHIISAKKGVDISGKLVQSFDKALAGSQKAFTSYSQRTSDTIRKALGTGKMSPETADAEIDQLNSGLANTFQYDSNVIKETKPPEEAAENLIESNKESLMYRDPQTGKVVSWGSMLHKYQAKQLTRSQATEFYTRYQGLRDHLVSAASDQQEKFRLELQEQRLRGEERSRLEGEIEEREEPPPPSEGE